MTLDMFAFKSFYFSINTLFIFESLTGTSRVLIIICLFICKSLFTSCFGDVLAG
jgi:hypothetical protein